MADVAVIAIEADLGAARLLAQGLRAEGIDAEAVGVEEGRGAVDASAALVFFATPAALGAQEWRGLAVMAAANRFAAVAVVAEEDVDRAALARVLPTDRIAPPEARAVMAVIAGEIGSDEAFAAPPAPALESGVGYGEGAAEEEPADDAQDSPVASPVEARPAPPPAARQEVDEPAPDASPPAKTRAPRSRVEAPGAVGGVLRRERGRQEGARRAKKAAPPPAVADNRRDALPADREEVADETTEAGPAAAIRDAKLFENAPRKMQVGARREVVVRIAANADAVDGAAGMAGEVRAHAIMAAQVMTVTLDDPDFAFAIRPLTPATQWIDRGAVARLGFLGAAATAEWRWSVEALKAGANRLAITASARVTDASGVSADAGLPPEMVTVRVRVAPARIIGRVARWAAIAIGAAVLGHYSVEIFEAARGLFG